MCAVVRGPDPRQQEQLKQNDKRMESRPAHRRSLQDKMLLSARCSPNTVECDIGV